jgi:hypothetical protein
MNNDFRQRTFQQVHNRLPKKRVIISNNNVNLHGQSEKIAPLIKF